MKADKRFLQGALFGALIMLFIGMAGIFLPNVFVHALGSDELKNKIQEAEQVSEKKLKKIQDMMSQYYLYSDDIEEEQLEDAIYTGFVSAMEDPYTVYYDQEATKQLLESTTGEYTGIGAAMVQNLETKEIIITTVYKDSPAEKAGLQEGDILYQVDEQVVGENDTSEVVSWIKGEVGTEVVLHVYRGDKYEEKTLTAVRDVIERQTVDYVMKENNTGYIYVSEFDKVTYDQFEKALTDLENQGLESLVIDLRNNPGGNLDIVVEMLRLLLPKGEVVSIQDKYGNKQVYECDGKHQFQKPLAVLVNGYSASASEIFAGAVKDYNLGTIVGTTTYGKGIVQELFNLGDGTMIKITTAEYFTPNGENIHGKGIEPDISIEYEYDENQPEGDSQLNKALEVVRESGT